MLQTIRPQLRHQNLPSAQVWGKGKVQEYYKAPWNPSHGLSLLDKSVTHPTLLCPGLGTSPSFLFLEAPFLHSTLLHLRPNCRVPGSVQAKKLVNQSRAPAGRQAASNLDLLWLSPSHKMRCRLKGYKPRPYAFPLSSTRVWQYAV